ncbi:uncharacterized protein LOC123962414 [Micropterus dolomieu]|uniref:uncharacterized protein LOC123962414 n=1 Tax=Micropterus dolomieu TaxID=147949 RepID=UPI001E8D6B15|nr:uncharacterized protein LOC123962414 [Micropterus dolomieu]XP_045894476.1 uncharacterized protein LOC123962414 [Micropterus dolomieu]XP_045894477.1 uncharacterized protein LOC123962414 [Micropterus dolomieu]
MIGRDVALEALGALLNANVTTHQNVQPAAYPRSGYGGAAPQQLFIKNFITTILDADDCCEVSKSNFVRLRRSLQDGAQVVGTAPANYVEITTVTGRSHFIDENEFYDPQFDYDFTNLRDTETYYRGGEVYERPCGWQRFALRVLNNYDGNTWLGTRYRSTESVPGEWPVSYHGTSKAGADGIIEGFYKPGTGQAYGRGVYSTPFIAEAIPYAKTFTSQKTGKKYQVILQNRINPGYREKHNNGKYWLVPIAQGTSATEEQKMVERAIRPYGLLVREV